MDACEFYLPKDSRDVAVLFKGGYHPIWYEYEWKFASEWFP